MTILKEHIKILKYVRRKKSVSVAKLFKKYSRGFVVSLVHSGYLYFGDYRGNIDVDWYNNGDFPPEYKIVISIKGRGLAEQHDWFDAEYVIRFVIAPIVIGVASSVLTNVILYALGLFR